jgi:hypothetical protein
LRGSVALTNDHGARHRDRTLPVLPLAALDQLARLHVETSQASRLMVFLRSAVHVASLFMLMGTCVLFLGGGATIGHNFSWAVLILIGVTGLLYSYIRTDAAVFDRAPVSEAARTLRALLFYMGLAWGAGAFLAVPPDLSLLRAVLFAVMPTFLLALMLNDMAGLAAFLVPAGALTIGAAFIRSWPDARLDAFLIPSLQCGVFIATILRRRAPLPAGLALR